MRRIIYYIVSVVMILSLVACGQKDEESETIVVGNGGNQIDIDSIDKLGGEESSDEETSDVESSEESAGETEEEKSDTVVITIDWDKIVINESECSNIEEMKDKIIKLGCKRIDLQHIDASKKTLDEVIAALREIEETLEIDINYN